MPRPPKGKPLTYRPVRLDDDVWAECQRLGKVHGTINEGLRVAFGWLSPLANQGAIKPVPVEDVAARPNNRTFKPPKLNKRERAAQELAASDLTAQVVERDDIEYGHHETLPRGEHVANVRPWKRGPRQKGDKTR